MEEGWGVLLSFAYVMAILSLAKGAEGKGWVSPFTARKLVHLFVGSWVLPTFFLFDHWFIAIVPPFSFVWVNLYLERKRFFSFGTTDRNFGAVYFPISFVILLTFCWEGPLRLFASVGILGMAWGDPLAALAGKRWGRHRYRLGGAEKSLEGSAMMWGGTFLGGLVSFLLFQPGPLQGTLAYSGIVATVATLVEAVSGRGMDNLTVPLGSAALCYFLVGF
ncbi:MAG: hypothetical protein HY590_00140 [Candidatus Omnitrophica bacterium]|nr:hypothetical protein [Candidatus Omnitrophota bacterium]